jgi:hypothetical protein
MKVSKEKFPYIICGLILILIICLLIIIPTYLQLAEKNSSISFDNWLQFFGSVGGAVLGGSITAIGLYLSLRENRKTFKIQSINDDMHILYEYYVVIGDLLVQSGTVINFLEGESIFSLTDRIVDDLYIEYTKHLDKYTLMHAKISDVNYHVKATEALKSYEEVRKLLKQTEFSRNNLEQSCDEIRKEAKRCNQLYLDLCTETKKEIEKLKKMRDNIVSNI